MEQTIFFVVLYKPVIIIGRTVIIYIYKHIVFLFAACISVISHILCCLYYLHSIIYVMINFWIKVVFKLIIQNKKDWIKKNLRHRGLPAGKTLVYLNVY